MEKKTIRNLALVSIAVVAAILFLGWRQALPTSAGLYLATRGLPLIALLVFGIRRRSLTAWILISMVIGTMIGHDFPARAAALGVLSQIFLRLIKTIVAPLLFATLVTGIAGHADLKKVGRMGLKSILYFEVVTTLALAIGLGAINLTRAGEGMNVASSTTTSETVKKVEQPTGSDIILHAFPENIAKAVAESQLLQVVIFSILFGIALALVRPERRAPMLSFCESLAEVMFKFTNLVMYFAPIGVGAAMAVTVGKTGIGVLQQLAMVIATLYGALVAFMLLVLLPVALLAKVPLKRFLKAVAEPASIAFGTSTSEAALPRAMERMEEMGVPRRIVAFVMPTGYSFNLDGSTLYLSIAAIFVAQASGHHLALRDQLFMMLALMLTSKGVAGVSRASLVILLGTVASFGLPAEPVAILLAIDPLMDMARTTVNVIGNCLATVVVAKWEGEFDETKAAVA